MATPGKQFSKTLIFTTFFYLEHPVVVQNIYQLPSKQLIYYVI